MEAARARPQEPAHALVSKSEGCRDGKRANRLRRPRKTAASGTSVIQSGSSSRSALRNQGCLVSCASRVVSSCLLYTSPSPRDRSLS
eukprot:9863-Pyramimonas_sp.AAC.1